MNKFLKYALAAGIVLACSITESQAQRGPQGVPQGQYHGGGNVVVNNYGRPAYGGYTYSGYGNYSYNNNCTGCFPGSGPYDSMIAVTGIAAGASIINNLINSTARPQPQVVYQSPPPVVYQQPQTVVVTPQANCRSYITGYGPNGQPIYVSTCN